MDTLDRIFSLLDETDLEQQQFAALVGVSDDTASNWRRKKSSSFWRYIPQIASALGTTIEYLFTGEEDKKWASMQNSRFADGLTEDESLLIEAYRRATEDDRLIVDAALRKYKRETTSATG